MRMEVGVVGKPNVGKSTFFKALTLAEVEIANFPFTTIKPNVGVGYVKSSCPHQDFGVVCNPNNSLCTNGFRFTPVKVIDVAGLVPGAHEGKGLGNQFLDDLRQADVLIHVVDASGRTNELGEPTEGHDPLQDVKFLEDEIDYWFADVIKRNLAKVKGKIRHSGKDVVKELSGPLAGLGVSEGQVKSALDSAELSGKVDLSDEEIYEFAVALRKTSKPILIAANKIDLDKKGNYERLKDAHDFVVPVCAEAELALRQASNSGLVNYTQGDGDFTLLKDGVDEKKIKALDFIRERVLSKYGGTGVQDALDKSVFDLLDYIVVYPVENENKLSNSKGSVLPDSYLLPEESTALDLAYKVHSDFGEKFIGAVDCRSKKKIGRDHVLGDGDVVKIIVGR